MFLNHKLSCETNEVEDEVTIPDTLTSYFLGNEEDKVTNSRGGIVMMGGNRENDELMKWFLDRSKSGDVLILRAACLRWLSNIFI